MRSMMTQWVRPGDGSSRATLVGTGAYVLAGYNQNPITIEEGKQMENW